jgi:hypothetical protein
MADLIPTPTSDEEVAAGKRSAWIATGYGIFALILLSLVAYSVAQYAVR